MLRVTTQGTHSKFLPTLKAYLPQAAHLCGVSYLAEGQDQSLTEVS